MPDLPSLDALVAAAGFSVEDGFQVLGPCAAAAVDASQPALALAPPGPEVLRRYPADAPVIPLVRRAGGVRAGAAVSAAALGAGGAGARAEEGTVVGWAFPALPAEDVRHDVRGLVGVIRRLRDPESGCPWDLAQDHRSLRPHLLEETYEALEALDSGDPGSLREELGDLLMQIVLHARVAEQAGTFTLGEVSEGIRAKLVRRHPHVFGEAAAETPRQVEAQWERLKAAERVGRKTGTGAPADGAAGGPGGGLDGVPATLPALARAQKLTGRAARQGFAWASDEDALAKLEEELREVAAAAPGAERAVETGDLLFVVCDVLRRQGVDAEDALREACGKFARRFRSLEGGLAAEGVAMGDLDQVALLERWEQVKARE